jgi:hypothetical protein
MPAATLETANQDRSIPATTSGLEPSPALRVPSPSGRGDWDNSLSPRERVGVRGLFEYEPALTANCPRCHGTGSGIYNALSSQSTCEVCDGTGLAAPAQSPAAEGKPLL